MKSVALLVAVALFGLIVSGRLSAQQQATGQIKGHVVDTVGATIRGASVYVRLRNSDEENIKLVTHTDMHGDFVLVLPEGAYDVLITSPSFASAITTTPVWHGKTKKLEWKLKVLDCDFPGRNCDTFQ